MSAVAGSRGEYVAPIRIPPNKRDRGTRAPESLPLGIQQGESILRAVFGYPTIGLAEAIGLLFVERVRRLNLTGVRTALNGYQRLSARALLLLRYGNNTHGLRR